MANKETAVTTESAVNSAVPQNAKTPEQLKAIETKRLEKIEARKRVLAFVAANEEQLGTIAADIRMFAGKAARTKGAGAPRSSVNAELRAALIEAGETGLSEMDIFKAFRIGRPEMNIKSRLFVQVDPADRVWFRFFPNEDNSDGVYKVVATGPKVPEGWEGHIPADKESL